MAASSLRARRPEIAVVALEKMATIMTDCGLRAHLALVPRTDLLALRELAAERRLRLVAACLDADGVPEILPERASTVALTERERVVLQALVEGGSHTEIAQRSSSPRTR